MTNQDRAALLEGNIYGNPNHCPESEADFGTIEGRIKWFCNKFDLEPPKVEYESDQPLLTDDLVDWCLKHHASLDWICMGNVAPALAYFRHINKMLAQQEKRVS